MDSRELHKHRKMKQSYTHREIKIASFITIHVEFKFFLRWHMLAK